MNEVIPNLVGGLPGVNGIFQIKFPKISNLAVQFFRTWLSKNEFFGLGSPNFFIRLGSPKMDFSDLAVQKCFLGFAIQKWIFLGLAVQK